MAYTPKTWANGQLVSAAELNRVENGVKALHNNLVGIQIWDGTAWSVRPTGCLFVKAYSDGTAGSVRQVNAPEPTGGINGDMWWKAFTNA